METAKLSQISMNYITYLGLKRNICFLQVETGRVQRKKKTQQVGWYTTN